MDGKYWEKLEGQKREYKKVYETFGAELNSQEKLYFDGFEDEISLIEKVTGGSDSTIFLVKLKDFKGRTQLVKVYSRLKEILKMESNNKDELKMVLNGYFKIQKEAIEILSKNSNPLNQKIIIKNEEFDIDYSVASPGILIEKNGEIGAWVRNWMPSDIAEGHYRFEGGIETYIKDFLVFLSSKLERNIKLCSANMKIYKDEENKKIKVVFTDLADDIRDFIKE